VIVVCIHCLREQDHPLADIITRLDRIERLVRTQGDKIMASFSDLAASVLTLTDTVTRVAADLEALKAGGNLTADQQAILDKAVADLTGDQATLDAVDPAPVPPVV